MNLNSIYNTNKTDELFGRYITNESIEPILNQLNTNNQLTILGYSVNNNPIYGYKIGNGKSKIMIWSQMHGNESTTTKAIIDFLIFLNSKSFESEIILKNCTLFFIPILNPDGAKLYTRENANKVDLNRDFVDQSQPETKVLLKLFNEFKPNFCFNMHDQRTIFGLENSDKPATVSFLAPSFNQNKDYNHSRSIAANIIGNINQKLQEYLPNQVGRFDDSFNINCAGDYFQSLKIPTILVEAGHFQNDYNREETRKFIFYSLFFGIEALNQTSINIDKYLEIPQNQVNFYDIIYNNVKIIFNNEEKIIKFAIQYIEQLIGNEIKFQAFFVKINNTEPLIGHLEYDAKQELYQDDNNNYPEINQKADFNLGNYKIINGIKSN